MHVCMHTHTHTHACPHKTTQPQSPLYTHTHKHTIIFKQIYQLNYFNYKHLSRLNEDNTYRISRPIRRTVIFSLEILEKNNDECILILVIYWKKTGLLHTKISNHNIIYLIVTYQN